MCHLWFRCLRRHAERVLTCEQCGALQGENDTAENTIAELSAKFQGFVAMNADFELELAARSQIIETLENQVTWLTQTTLTGVGATSDQC